MYLIVPASNVNSCQPEVDQIQELAKDNNLALNRSKSAKLVIRAKSRHSVVEPPPAVLRFTRVEWLKVLGVTINNWLSFDKQFRHITEVLARCTQTMFALWTHQAHRMPSTLCPMQWLKWSCAMQDQLALLQRITIESMACYSERWGLDIGQSTLQRSITSSWLAKTVSSRESQWKIANCSTCTLAEHSQQYNWCRWLHSPPYQNICQ